MSPTMGGAVRAFDPHTLDKRWEFKMNDITWAGVLTTASDLVFSGGKEGYFFALDARSGDLLWKEHFPNLIDATTESWIRTLAELLGRYGSDTFVPGHGELATAEDVATFRQYLVELRAAISRGQAAGKSGDALVEAVLPDLQTKYGKWAFFDDYARDDIRQTAEELSGHKKIPVPATAADRQ